MSLDEFYSIVETLPQEDLYRTVYDPDFAVLLPGKEIIDDQILQDFSCVDFSGKTVADLGCNFGFFSFQAKRLGASSVLGVDYADRVILAARELADAFEMDGVTFETHDIYKQDSTLRQQRFDVAMLVEFIGKSFIGGQMIDSALHAVECLTDKEIVLSIQKIYWINKELKTTPEALLALYPEKYIQNGDFLLFEYVKDYFADRWTLECLSELVDAYQKPRIFLRLFKA
ncbi:class I SAM-dependent methyltransferase [Desulfovibrio inopinatus]|uniref:class I SAM-dependent methyltransferase n=1 Tax=Desulfovibrio inopinatus TaxID=102109 RepID=UPI00041E13ED|nr:methyltransferase domain-containing protein [Desulfovibrio inopinatus]